MYRKTFYLTLIKSIYYEYTVTILPFHIVLFLFTGCNSTGTDPAQPTLALSVTARNSPLFSGKQNPTVQNSPVTITEAKILIREVELKSDLEDDGIADDSLDFKSDSFVVVLNLEGTPNEVALSEVASGTHDEIEFEVHKPEDNETPPDSDFQTGTSGDERFSVIISGTYDGQDFIYRSRENMEQKIELNAPLEIAEDSGPVNLTMLVDLSEWFMDENGNSLAPNNPENKNAIDDTIRRSFEDIFKDNNKDGQED